MTDPKPVYFPEEISYNDQESIIEIVLEKILGYQDACTESDDHDNENQNKKKTDKKDLITYYTFAKNYPLGNFNDLKNKPHSFQPFLSTGFSQIDSPPPKV